MKRPADQGSVPGPHVNERLTFGHGAFAGVPAQAMAATPALAHEPVPFRFTHLETWDWGWGGLLIFSVLLFFRPQDQIAALGRMHLSDLAAIVGLSAMVFINIGRRQPPARISTEVAAMGLLGLVLLVTVPFSFWPGGSVRVFTTLFLQVSLIFLLMVNTITSPRRVERINWVIVLAFGYISARVCFDYLRGVNLVEGHRAAGPIGGFFANPNDLALNLAAFLPLTMMNVKRPGPLMKRLLCAVFVVLMLCAIVFTKSRSGMIGTAVMLTVFVLVSRMLRPTYIIAGIAASMLIVPAIPGSFWERMSSITDASKDDTGSRRERVLLMEAAWDAFLAHPLTGVGAGQFKNYGEAEGGKHRETHNVLLQIGAEIGIFGVLTFVFLIVRAFSAAWWTRRQLSWIYAKRHRKRATSEPEDGLDHHDRLFLETHGAAMLAGLAGWLAAAMFASVAFNWTFYYLLGLSVTARDVVRSREAAYAKAKTLAAREVAA